MKCWNIRRGLVKRELEIVNLIADQKLDVLFLVETDTNQIMEEKDYKLKGFKTVFPLRSEADQTTHMICLINLRDLNKYIHTYISCTCL